MILDQWFLEASKLITREHIVNFLIAMLLFFGGIFIAGKSRNAIQRLPQLDVQQRLLLTKLSYYGLLGLTVAATLAQLGFKLNVILGAAGILTVAVGFAAQTSASNLISGIFLMAERPFVVGDVVGVGDTKGEVMSIDLLSTKIRTFSNLMIRIPNEKMVKSDIVNFSYFPIRRLDFTLAVGYSSDIDFVESLLRQVATSHPLCLEDPKPIFLFNGFGDSAMNMEFRVWTLTGNMTMLQNELYRDIKRAFDAHKIDIPFPTRMMISGSPSGPATGPT